MTDVRQSIVNWAKWGVDNHAGFTYTEDGSRMEGIGHPGVPCHADCSAFVTLCYNWSGAADPNGQGYNGTGYTGTLLSHGQEIPLSQVQPGDAIVYGSGTGDHTALIVEAGPDPLTVSHGQQGDPSYCRVSQDGRQPQRYLRFDTTKIGPGYDPNGSQPEPTPTPETSGDEEMAVAKINANGLEHVFYVDNSGNFGHNFRPNGGEWGRDAAAFSGLLPNATPVVEVDTKGTINVYVRGGGNKVRHYVQKAGQTTWTEDKLP